MSSQGWQLSAAIAPPLLSCSSRMCSPSVSCSQVSCFPRRAAAQRCSLLQSALPTQISVALSASPLGNFFPLTKKAPVRRRGERNVVSEVAAEVVGGALSSEGGEQKVGVGSRVRVKGPAKVFHIPKVPEFELDGLEGEVKDVLGTWKGKLVSATLPYKVQFDTEIEGRKVKFVAHLKDNEFEVV